MTKANKVKYNKNNLGSGGGWHRDDFNFQFKAILYLNDVSMDNGPFQLIENSNGLINIIKDIGFDWHSDLYEYVGINIDIGFSKTQEQALKNGLAREILIFSIAFTATRDIVTAFILTGTFMLLSDVLFRNAVSEMLFLVAILCISARSKKLSTIQTAAGLPEFMLLAKALTNSIVIDFVII